MKTKKTDNNDFLKDYQNLPKVGEKPVDLRNTQLVFESQNRVDPKKKKAIFENILKIRGEEGYNGWNSYKTRVSGSPKLLLYYLRNQLQEASTNSQQIRRKLTGLKSS